MAERLSNIERNPLAIHGETQAKPIRARNKPRAFRILAGSIEEAGDIGPGPGITGRLLDGATEAEEPVADSEP
jgi:hypothetical protein